jgi:hypothetical protein
LSTSSMLNDKIKKQSWIKKLTKTKEKPTKKKEWASNMKGKMKGWNWKGKKNLKLYWIKSKIKRMRIRSNR